MAQKIIVAAGKNFSLFKAISPICTSKILQGGALVKIFYKKFKFVWRISAQKIYLSCVSAKSAALKMQKNFWTPRKILLRETVTKRWISSTKFFWISRYNFAEMERTIKLIDKINATHTFCLLPLTARICSVFPIFSRAIGINFKVR